VQEYYPGLCSLRYYRPSCLPQYCIAEEDILIVHYKRYAAGYEARTLWTWDAKTGQDSRELEEAGEDDCGLIFHVLKSDYGDGTNIGLLPKFKEWESKDPPDRTWTSEIGDEVWILSGHPQLFTAGPGEDLMGKEVGAIITVHYHRPQGDYSDWTLWTWDNLTDQDSREISASETDDYGLVFEIERKNYGDGTQIGLLPKYGNWASKDLPDRIWFPYRGNEVWILAGNEELFSKMPDTTPWVTGAFVDAGRLVTVSLSTPIKAEDLKPESFSIKDKAGQKIKIVKVRRLPPRRGSAFTVGLALERDLDPRSDPILDYVLRVKGFKPKNLAIRRILDSPEFYSEAALGANYSKDETIFRVFAPTASAVILRLYDEPTGGVGKDYPMDYSANGVWEASISGDLKGTYYVLKVSGADPRLDPGLEVIDPYSRCNTAHDGRGMIVEDKTPVAPAPALDISEAIIYELHVRDFTIDKKSGLRHAGKYLGFTETGTTLAGNPDIRTGIDHLEELGINVVHVMPIQDFDNDEAEDNYNWGYMPVHFNSPDGWFATQRHNTKRVEEFKRLVDALHKKGTKVVMDVVYNHTAEYWPHKIFSFEGLVPGYYYRLKDDGAYWNGSGTGNEIRSEAPMMRKFILDSVKYWVTEYGVDGFRFDLMGLIDLETMVSIVEELRAIKPDIIIYGEPWTGGETPIIPLSKGSQKGRGFSVFGDHFRDAVKGGVFDLNKGYVQAGVNIDRIKRGIEGSINDFTESPAEAINYVASHDNRTLWDRLVVTTRGDANLTNEDLKRMDRLGAVLVLTSQGIPFLHSGQEMLRTKRGDHNSYNKPDAINMIDWQWKKDNFDIFAYYKGLIDLRKAHPVFRMKTRDDVTANLKFLDDHLGISVPPRCIGYRLTKGSTDDTWKEVLVLLNPNPAEAEFKIPDGKWKVVVDNDEAGTRPVKTGASEVSGKKVKVPRISAMILHK
jgi:pullulanase